MLLKDFINTSVSELQVLYPYEEARSVILLLCEYELGVKSYTHIVEPQYVVENDKLSLLLESVSRLKTGEPLQYVLGFAEFCGRRFKVDSNVLIPRPETEVLCHRVIEEAKKIRKSEIRILDLCTGSGCIAWTLALSIPSARVYGVDISRGALDVARSQYFDNEDIVSTPEFMEMDILDYDNIGKLESLTGGAFDIIVSNPPYVKRSESSNMRINVLNFEPDNAIFVSDSDPLVFYQAISLWSKRLLADGGIGMTEINDVLSGSTKDIFINEGFQNVDEVKDFYDKTRFIFYIK